MKIDSLFYTFSLMETHLLQKKMQQLTNTSSLNLTDWSPPGLLAKTVPQEDTPLSPIVSSLTISNHWCKQASSASGCPRGHFPRGTVYIGPANHSQRNLGQWDKAKKKKKKERNI